MKNLFFFFFILISIDSFAQTSVYHPFPDSNVVWNVEIASQCSVGLSDHFWNSYIIDGDTTIGLNNYRKVYSAWVIEHWTCWGMNFSSPGDYVGAIRQDTAARTVYYCESTSAIENLLYNFNLHAGDTLRGYLTSLSNCSDDSIIAEEDSIFIDGNYRKRWKLNLWFGPNYIIEGIGFTGGPFSPACSWFEGGATLVCCTQDNVILFQDSMYTTTPGLCGVINTIPSIENKQEVRLYPNPFHESAILETSIVPAKLEIYNTIGIKVFEQEIVSAQTIIQSKHFKNGLYLFLLKRNSVETLSGKFIKE